MLQSLRATATAPTYVTRQKADDHLKSEGVSNSLVVSRAEVLRGEDPRGRGGAEDQKIEDENKLIHDGNARHLLGAQASHHHVIQEVDHISDAVLHHNGHGDLQQPTVKIAVADQAFQKHSCNNPFPYH